MAGETEERALGRISPEALHAATGRAWEAWLSLLDAAGAADWDHKRLVAHLEGNHPEVPSGWWRQTIAVAYERARGTRVVGQAATGFQVGVQRTVAGTAAQVWKLIVSRPELWLGEGASIAFEEGRPYEVPPAAGAPGARGEVRVVRPGNRLRMSWQPEGWAAPATLQLALSQSGSAKTAITAHMERLPDADAREAMRARWREALERIAAAAA